MKKIGISLDNATSEQMKELADLWGLTEVRHNTPVIMRCVERVWMQEIGCKKEEGTEEEETAASQNAPDNTNDLILYYLLCNVTRHYIL